MQKKYFVRANTSSGCVNLAENNFYGITQVYRLCGKSARIKSDILKMIAGHFDLLGEETECIISPFNITLTEGIIVRGRKFAVVNEEVLKIGENIDVDKCLSNTEMYLELKKKSADCYSRLYEAYSEAKKVHDEWEKIYISNMDFKMLESYENEMISQLISRKKDKNPIRCDRFFGASTQDGSVNYIDNLTEGLKQRFFIKGRPGTGKSTFLKRLAKAASDAGYDTEVYWCSFDKNSLDMVIVPELDFCVFDSTAPHELFPSRKGDSIMDFYEKSGLSGVDEKYSDELKRIGDRYKFRITEGVNNLRLGGSYFKEREYYLNITADKEEVSRIADRLIRKAR